MVDGEDAVGVDGGGEGLAEVGGGGEEGLPGVVGEFDLAAGAAGGDEDGGVGKGGSWGEGGQGRGGARGPGLGGGEDLVGGVPFAIAPFGIGEGDVPVCEEGGPEAG